MKIFLILISLCLFCSTAFGQKIRIMPLGDSITKGSNDSTTPNSLRVGYRQQLWLDLDSAGYKVDFVGSENYGYAATPSFDSDNAGFPGITDREIYNLLINGYDSLHNKQVTPGPYLNYYDADVIVLHIGTNDTDTSTTYLEDILNYLDDYQDSTNSVIWVVLSKIINQVPYSLDVSAYNSKIDSIAKRRIANGDRIMLVDMENDAHFVYNKDTISPFDDGDMWDGLHPNPQGYDKMGNLFYDSLSVLLDKITPVELAGITSTASVDSVTLAWSTAIELNNSGFEIERSEDGLSWITLGFVEGAINSYNLKFYYFIDNTITTQSKHYIYRLKQVSGDSTFNYLAMVNVDINVTSVDPIASNYPKDFSLEQNYPNPFNPSTTINYEVPSESSVKLTIYNTLGQEVKTLINSAQSPGKYSVTFDAANLASGMYVYVLNATSINNSKNFRLVKKMILQK